MKIQMREVQTYGRKIFELSKLSILVSGGNADSSAAGCSDGAVCFNVSGGWCGHGCFVCCLCRWLFVISIEIGQFVLST